MCTVSLVLSLVSCATQPDTRVSEPTTVPSHEVAAADAAPAGMPGDNVSEPSTLIALDAATGQQLWEAIPPMMNARPVHEGDDRVTLDGLVSPSQCAFLNASATLDASSGALISAEIVDAPRTLAEGIPPIHDGALSISYVAASGALAYGLEAVDTSTGSTVWTIVEGGATGPALFNPAVFGFGVIAAPVGGRNPVFAGPATAVEFIDEQNGVVLWSEPGDAAVAIGGGLAYVLNSGSFEAHDVRTGSSRWSHETDASQVAANDEVVVVSDAARTVAYDASGSQLWETPIGTPDQGYFRGGLLVGTSTVFAVTRVGLDTVRCVND